MRTFIAIDLEDQIKKNVSALIQKWDRGDKNIRWVRPQGMHLTLKFLGEVTEDKTDEVKSVLEKIAKDYSPFRLYLRGTGTFPPGVRHPRVIWVGIEMNETLEILQRRLENELHNIRIPKEKRKFHPHLTLGRIKGAKNLGGIIESIDQHKEFGFGGMEVNKITLFKSTLKPTGAEYNGLAEFYLE